MEGTQKEFSTCLASELGSLEFHFGYKLAGFHAAKYGPHDPVAGYDTRRASIARLHH